MYQLRGALCESLFGDLLGPIFRLFGAARILEGGLEVGGLIEHH